MQRPAAEGVKPGALPRNPGRAHEQLSLVHGHFGARILVAFDNALWASGRLRAGNGPFRFISMKRIAVVLGSRRYLKFGALWGR